MAILLADLCSLAIAIGVCVLVRHAFQGDYNLSMYWRLWPVLGLFASVYALFGLYPGVASSPVNELRLTSAATTVVFLVLGALTFVLRVADTYSRMVFLMAWLVALPLVPLARAFVRHRFARRPWWGYPALVFGAGVTGKTLLKTLRDHPEMGFRPVAVLDEEPETTSLYGVPMVSGLENAPLIARELGISHAFVAMPDSPRQELLDLLESHAATFSHVIIIPDLHGLSSLGVEARDLCRVLALEVHKSLLLPGPRLAKRLIDMIISLGVLLATSPLLALICALVKLESRGPVFYGHERIGRRETTFRCWKFRSMVLDADRVLREHLAQHPDLAEEWKRDHKLKKDPRITRIGRILRKTSLDELPQLWNVVCGHMSLVGPRPIVYDEVEKYGDGFGLYSRVLPGLTGLWQVSGRNNTSYEERVALDTYYVRNWSPWLDIYLLARTVKVVVLGEGAY